MQTTIKWPQRVDRTYTLRISAMTSLAGTSDVVEALRRGGGVRAGRWKEGKGEHSGKKEEHGWRLLHSKDGGERVGLLEPSAGQA